MESRRPIYEGTVMGAVSLEHTISGAALKMPKQERLHGPCRICTVVSSVCTIRANFLELLQKEQQREFAPYKLISMEKCFI